MKFIHSIVMSTCKESLKADYIQLMNKNLTLQVSLVSSDTGMYHLNAT
jgi:hypothetical protein